MWEKGGYFQPRIDEGQQAYTIVMPPPNVTGELHLGHGLEDSITDALVQPYFGPAPQAGGERGLVAQRLHARPKDRQSGADDVCEPV